MPIRPTPTIGLVAEGETDQNVLDAILAGYFDDPNFEARRIRPLTSAAQDDPKRFGSWTNVLNFLKSPDFEESFQELDLIVIQIDTDVCEQFGISRQEAGETLQTTDLITRIEGNLKERINADTWSRIGHQVVFAVTVDSIECWMLLLYAEAPKQAREQNCLHHLVRELKKNDKTKKLQISESKKLRRTIRLLPKNSMIPKH